MIKKYAVVGGPIMSENDGDLHYVNAGTLCDLYSLDRRECILYDRNRPGFFWHHIPPELIVLGPRYDGNYEVPR